MYDKRFSCVAIYLSFSFKFDILILVLFTFYLITDHNLTAEFNPVHSYLSLLNACFYSMLVCVDRVLPSIFCPTFSILLFCFQYQRLKNAPVRCPHCRKVSSVGPRMAIVRGTIFAVLSFIFLAIALGVTLGTLSAAKSQGGGIYVAYVGAFLVAFLLGSRAVYYFAMKVSKIEGPM